MRRYIFILFLILPFVSVAQQLEAFKDVVPSGYNFWVYTPPADSIYSDSASRKHLITCRHCEVGKKPLVIFLHGASLCGRDLQRVRRYGVLHAIQMGLELDAYVLAPQNPGGAWKPSNINNCLNYAITHYPIDTNHIYVFGMSLGGFGTVDYLAVYHGRIAAAMSLCGGGNPHNYCGLNEVPLWLVHGNADRQVPLASAHKIVNGMRKCDNVLPRLRFSELDGVNHAFPARLFYLEMPYRWLFEHSLSDQERLPNPNYEVSTVDMHNAYRLLRKNDKYITVKTFGNAMKEVVKADKKKDTEAKKDKKVATKGGSTTYKVKRGDSLGKIAARHGTTISKICKLNGIGRNDVLREGQKLQLP